jgi:hypothetical protein
MHTNNFKVKACLPDIHLVHGLATVLSSYAKTNQTAAGRDFFYKAFNFDQKPSSSCELLVILKETLSIYTLG